MSYLLNLAYALLLLVALPWLVYARLARGKYRRGFGAKFFGRVPCRPGQRRCIWLHGVSVGEVNLIASVARKLEEQLPDFECVVSTTTDSGYELARSKLPGHLVFYCPLDFSWAASQAMRCMHPDLLILAELELWPNLLAAASRQGAKVAIINGRLSASSWRGYNRLRLLFAHVLRGLDLIAVQNELYADRFRQLGAPAGKVHVTGSLKFDGAEAERDNPATRRLARLAQIAPSDVVFLAGSTQQPEEVLALDVYRRLCVDYPALRLILVPRHPERFDEVARMLDRSGCYWQRRTQVQAAGAAGAARILLVDTIGELAAWWGTADVGFVGGSFGRRGGQNMIEPAAYVAAVTFGPDTHNFRDVVSAMLRAEAAVVVSDGEDLYRFVRRCLDDPDYRRSLGERARQLVQEQRGATDKTISLIRDLLSDTLDVSARVGATEVARPIHRPSRVAGPRRVA